MLADDRADGIDMLVDQQDRDLLEVRRMLKQPAQALGGAGNLRITESGDLALNVVRGAKQRIVGLFGKAQALDVLARAFEAFAFGFASSR